MLLSLEVLRFSSFKGTFLVWALLALEVSRATTLEGTLLIHLTWQNALEGFATVAPSVLRWGYYL